MCANFALRHFFAASKLALLVCCCLWLAAPASVARGEDLASLQAIERRIVSVAAQNMSATVSITDGVGYGSGVIVDPRGLVLTAGHVVISPGREYRVYFPNGREVRARPLGKNLSIDAGMLELVENGPWPYVPMGSSRSLSRGDWVVCLGHAGGYQVGRLPPVRAGRVLDFEPHVIVTDCALIGGDSGGPLFDIDGRLVGIHSNIGSSIAENRHVPVDSFRRNWDRMVRGDTWGRLPSLEIEDRRRGVLGIRVDPDSTEARISEVHRDGAAERAGLFEGDVIRRFDGVPVHDGAHLIELVQQRKAGDRVPLQIERGSVDVAVEITLRELR